MGRIKIEIPENWVGVVEMPVRITDINYGNHLGNDAVVSIIHEARVSWLKSMGYSELNIEGTSIIMSDLAVSYSNESFYGDILKIKLAIGDFSSAGFELYYSITTNRNDKEIQIAKAKTGIVFYNYEIKKIAGVPQKFKSKMNQS
jgi:acyl-CoA thioesterase FadM